MTCSSSGGAAQTALGILRACYVSWLHQGWSAIPVQVQPTDITSTLCLRQPEWRLFWTVVDGGGRSSYLVIVPLGEELRLDRYLEGEARTSVIKLADGIWDSCSGGGGV
jgi:hypothetical protein